MEGSLGNLRNHCLSMQISRECRNFLYCFESRGGTENFRFWVGRRGEFEDRPF